MAAPTLIIGLGGTGLKIATHIKKNLLEENGNRLPAEVAILVLDTEREVKYLVGQGGQKRDDEHTLGTVSIDHGEYIALGGNVRPMVEAITKEPNETSRDQRYRHLSSWFPARHYLDVVNLPDQVWNLNEGVGRYRQLGRLAFFRNIAAIEQKLRSSIQTVQRVAGGKSLCVHVVGSLVGGSGAALFADVAHLVRWIAQDVASYSQEHILLGHFVLAEAFRGTLPIRLKEPGIHQSFNANMFAALRELTRLQSPITRRAGGYPLYYDSQGTGSRKARLAGKPYDAVYLYDGQAERVQLNQRPLQDGLAPAIADVVTAYADELSGGAFRSHAVNRSAFYNAYNIPSGTVTYGSAGVYTIELPMYHITEGWAHRLATETLEALVAPDPSSIDRDTDVPSRLVSDRPGYMESDPQAEAKTWRHNNTTSLINQICDWGQRGSVTETLRNQVIREILGPSADDWLQQFGPDPRFADYMAEAQAVLKASLLDKSSTNYYVELDQGGSTAQGKALNLQREIDGRLHLMVGDSTDVWKRQGGEFRHALIRLGNHHVQQFENTLIKTIAHYLNGTEMGNAVTQKSGKLGFVLAFLSHLESMLAGGAELLALADRQNQAHRRPQFDGIDSARRAAFAKLQQGGGLLRGNARVYREKSNELAQFHKVDIARQVVHDLAARLHKDVAQLLTEARLWETALATAIADNGGAYAQVVRGKKEVESDRLHSQNAVRWVIADDEPGDHYISDKYAKYARDQVAGLLQQVQWKVGRVDGSGDMRIDFTLAGQAWSREAGQRRAANAGQRNVGQLLALCRRPFDQAWTDMSVTAYLYQNFYEEANRLDQLAERVYKNSGYLLNLTPRSSGAKMRTVFVRVHQENLNYRGDSFLRDLLSAVDKEFNVTTSVEQRQTSAPNNQGYISDRGQPSTDPYKISFLIYGDLLLPEDIQAFGEGRQAYQTFSAADARWRELHVFPAETNALQLERDLKTIQHRRREFDPDVVAILEDMAIFQTAVRCLAYGDPGFRWNGGDDTGLLLHVYTPPEENPAGHSYWRLVLMPEGRRGADGVFYDSLGRIARPLAYQLSPMAAESLLLEAFVQLLGCQSDYNTGMPIDWARVEGTLAQAMSWHRDQWGSVGELGWRLLPNKDITLRDELKDEAAQLVRLVAFQKQLDDALAQHRWAWEPHLAEMPPRLANDRFARGQIQPYVDLLTAMRVTASQQRESLGRRLAQIGVQVAVMPPEVRFVRWPSQTEEQPNTWLCANGHANLLDYGYCGECGLPRPPIFCLNGHELEPNWLICPFCDAPAAPIPRAAPPSQVWLVVTAAMVPARPHVNDPVELRCRIDTTPLREAGSRGELTLLVEAPGMEFHEQDHDSETFLLDANTPARLDWSVRLRARQPGRQQLLIRSFLNGVAGPETKLDVLVGSASKLSLPTKLLAFPEASAGQLPDLILRSYASPVEGGTAHRLVFYAFSPHRQLNLLGQPFGEVHVQQGDLQRFRSRLALALEASRLNAGEDLRSALQALGTELHDLVLPVEVQHLYREVGRQVNSLLLLHDLEPWVPWELIYFEPEDMFLSQAHRFGRWIEGLGVPRVHEFPMGQVSLALTANARAGHVSPGSVTELFDPTEFPSLRGKPLVKAGQAFFAGFDYRSPIWGLHIEHSLVTSPATTSLATVTAPADTLALARANVLDLRRRQPLVTMGCGRAEGATPELTDADAIWATELIKRGASAFVGSLWTVAAESSRLFWSELYGRLWQAAPLGLAVQQAREAVVRACPDSMDWLSFFLLGDPTARGYRPTASQGYVTVECPDHNLTAEALKRDQPYVLLACLRLTPPLWNPQRRSQVIEDSWTTPRVDVFGPAFDIPAASIELVDTSPGVRVARFTITPQKAGEQDLLIRFLSGQSESRHSIALRLVVEE